MQESTLGVELLSSSSRQGASGATLYSYEYELASTRGTKRLLNTVTITGAWVGQGKNPRSRQQTLLARHHIIAGPPSLQLS